MVDLGGALDDADLARLSERLRVLLQISGARVVVCDVGALSHPDVATVEVLARLQLTAQRLGGRVRLRHASTELRELLALAGLCEVVGLFPGLAIEPSGETEEREESGRVQEEGQPADPTT